jgi:O-succinylhomoserine sulfhydrylase
MTEQSKNKQTIAVRGAGQKSVHGEHAEALYFTSGYVFENAAQAAARFAGDEPGAIYGRLTNPTVQSFESHLAMLEDAEYCVATATGMAAINCVFTGLLNAGDHVVASSSLFGSTIILLDKIFSRFGIETTFVPINDLAAWQEAVRVNTKLLFLETPSNPLCELGDVRAIADIAHSAGAQLVVDNTYNTPILQNPLQQGADVVVHSATKYIDGQGRLLAGAVVTNDEDIYEEVFSVLRTAGASLSPMNAWSMNQALQTLPLRMNAHCDSALRVAHWLEAHPAVERVYYPGLESHPQHQLATQQQRGYGGMLSFEVKGDKAAAWHVMDSCEMISLSVNLGDTRTIITHPASTSHGRLTPEERERAGVADNLIRLSVGLEAVEDITADLSRGLDTSVVSPGK